MEHQLSTERRLHLLAGIVILGLISVALLPAIPQDPSYHDFTDQRGFWRVPNALNFLSNVFFIGIGVAGCRQLSTITGNRILADSRWLYQTFFAGVVLVGIGSGYYHWSPTNTTLIWDRLPMTVAFMAFFSIIIAEYISEELARKLFIPLLLLGVGSVWYWHFTESQGRGDLRPYIVVQFLPMLLIPAILLLFPSRFSHGGYYWAFLGAYVAAKILELGDLFFYQLLYGISGHTLKHVAVAIGCYLFYRQLQQRSRTDDTE